MVSIDLRGSTRRDTMGYFRTRHRRGDYVSRWFQILGGHAYDMILRKRSGNTQSYDVCLEKRVIGSVFKIGRGWDSTYTNVLVGHLNEARGFRTRLDAAMWILDMEKHHFELQDCRPQGFNYGQYYRHLMKKED